MLLSKGGLGSKKMCHGLGSTSSTSSVSHVWADLSDDVIHQIIALLSLFHDLLAFTSTCRSWRAAASSFSSAYTFNFPPLHLKPDFSYTRKRSKLGVFSLLRDGKWLLGDPAKRNLSLRCSVPEIVQIAYCIWDAHMGILSSPTGSTASLAMCTLALR